MLRSITCGSVIPMFNILDITSIIVARGSVALFLSRPDEMVSGRNPRCIIGIATRNQKPWGPWPTSYSTPLLRDANGLL